MATWRYQAVDATGRAVVGTVEASGDVAARAMVRDLGLLPTRVQETGGAGRAGGVSRLGDLFARRVTSRSLAAATRQLSTMIGSDIRIEEAVRVVGQETAGQPIGPVLLDVAAAITEGRSFASALDRHPRVFPEFYRSSIAAGEQSGKLSEVLAHLTDFVASRERAERKVQLALLYPALLAAVSTLMIVLLLVYVVPDIVKVFVSRGASLPLLTRILIGLSEGAQRFGVPLLILLAVGALAWNRWLAVPANALKFAKFRLTTPPLAEVTRQLNAARFAGSLATLVRSDVPLVEAMRAAAAVTPNLYVRQRALAATQRVREGASLRHAMQEADVFPRLLLAVVASGEQSGRLGPGLARAAADLEQDLEQLVTALVALVEPAVLLIMGGVVLLMVLAILMPIVNLNNLAGL
ncbi:type II secretion system F family protein [Brevundimonas sp.]|uniref:type II secretion system F family protein n=1 Tax=Brevundimonas sp. TaxID=1871086 RepID=UPI002638BF2A|nr:type II secretion system F family protein [Brevundimonas sp.]